MPDCVLISTHAAHGAQGISAMICMDIALRKHCDESLSRPWWKANFDQGKEGNVSMPPGITEAGSYRGWAFKIRATLYRLYTSLNRDEDATASESFY